ncbi:MAG: hypothetical protein ACUZ8E_09875 [Candidatus Anammoxibacter sp.]
MKLLKSKGIVGVLVVVAIGFVAKNVLLPLLDLKGGKGDSSSIQTENIRNDISPVPVAPKTSDPAPLAVLDGVGWFLDSKRDPFKDVSAIDEVAVVSNSTLENDEPVEAAEPVVIEPEPVIIDLNQLLETIVIDEDVVVDSNLILEGIMIEPGKRFAVINGEIVTEGDDYEDYKVIRIYRNLVRLKGSNGYQSLTLTDTVFEKINERDETDE